MHGNEFKPMGLNMKFNGCDFFRKNLFGIRDTFYKIGNIELCNFVKVSTSSSSFKFL